MSRPDWEDSAPFDEYERGVRDAREEFNKMWSSKDWDGQVSLGFASVHDEALDILVFRHRGLM